VVALPSPVAEILAALSYGERLAARRAQEGSDLAPDARGRQHQAAVAAREGRAASLLEARLGELGSLDMERVFAPFFDAFFERTSPSDWEELQAFHYVGDAIVADFAEALIPVLDPVSAEVVRSTIAQREELEVFALDELTRSLDRDPAVADRIAIYARRVIGEALTQTRRALDATTALRDLLGGQELEKRVLLDLLDRHRRRLDRLGIEPVD
jgi:tRNA-(MS[2]IO[6]A)-hydroxylase MiaE-like protein